MSQRQTFSQKSGFFNHKLKENNVFGDLSLGMSCSVDPNGASYMLHETTTTMNLFPITEKPTQDFKSMNSFTVPTVFASSLPKEGVSEIADSSVNKPASGEPGRAQMTIFYAGQVYVFDHLSADKAKEIMILASKESSKKTNANSIASLVTSNVAFPHLVKNPIDSSNVTTSSSATVPIIGKEVLNENVQPSSRPIVCDLPIARKASLHRFLEKRKDRISAKAPYSTVNTISTPTKPDESKSWLGLAAQPSQ